MLTFRGMRDDLRERKKKLNGRKKCNLVYLKRLSMNVFLTYLYVMSKKELTNNKNICSLKILIFFILDSE